MSDNPYHNQHIKEITECIDETVTQLQFYYDAQFKTISDALAALDARMERLESIVGNNETRKSGETPTIEAEVVVTKDSLKKLRKTIMNLFR